MIKNRYFQTLFLIFLLLNASHLYAQDTSLKLHYLFHTSSGNQSVVTDDSGNGYTANLINGAAVKEIGDFNVLDLGSTDGYLDFGSNLGALVNTLTNFTISTYLYIEPESSLSSAGNFVWTFSNSDNMASDKNGCLFFSAKDSRYSISKIHWTGEQSVSLKENFVKGEWKHVTYTQDGTTGALYYNGVKVKTGIVDIFPGDLGSTVYNFLGRSAYQGDAYLANTLFYDFRIYNRALNASEVSSLSGALDDLKNAGILAELGEAAKSLELEGLDEVKTDLELPTVVKGISVSWKSANTNYITDQGEVTRPAFGENEVKVELTATFLKNGISVQKLFLATVLPYPDDQTAVERDVENIIIIGQLDNLRSNLYLPAAGIEGSKITWASSDVSFLTDTGEVLRLSPKGSGKTHIVLTATVTKGAIQQVRTFDIYIAEDEEFSAYLFAYFTGNGGGQEAIRFALSHDGFTYRAVNNNNPIVSSAAISSTGGVRDPHILRGEDGWFYMVATDLQVAVNGWNNNQAMVLLKSDDLVNWTSSIVNIAQMFPEMSSVIRVWAPQTIYDPEVGKYMIYWSMKFASDENTSNYYDRIYYAYANDDFTSLETTPKQLYFSPTNTACIDGDIIYFEGQYHLFHKTEGNGNGIKKAISDKLTSSYVLYDKYLDQTDAAVEGSSVFKLINSDKYILMYDMYTSGTYQFTESTDLVNFKVADEAISFDFTPRHGTVIPITSEEAKRVAEKWCSVDDITVYAVESSNNEIENSVINNSTKRIYLQVTDDTDISTFAPTLVTNPGTVISPEGAVNFTDGPVNYTISINGVGEKIYKVSVTGGYNAVNEFDAAYDFTVYPNPTNEQLTIKSAEPMQLFELYSISGQLILSRQLEGLITFDIQVGNYRPGVYILKIDQLPVQMISIK